MGMVRIALVVLISLVVSLCGVAMVTQNILGPNVNQGWPFGDDPHEIVASLQDDFLVSLGANAFLPGSGVTSGLGISFQVAPFFTESQTDVVVLPGFTMTQSLETGISYPWWFASVGVDLSLFPWSLTSTGAWLELHPPQWVMFTAPWMTLDGRLGWGPQWSPTQEWLHAVRGSLDIQAIWALSTLWESTLDLCAASNLDIEWTFPNGSFITDWMLQWDARSILPVFVNSPAALRAGARAQVFVFPVFGFGFDVRLEFRADRFTAYGLIGAGGAGIRAEVGAAWSMGWSLFGDLD